MQNKPQIASHIAIADCVLPITVSTKVIVIRKKSCYLSEIELIRFNNIISKELVNLNHYP